MQGEPERFDADIAMAIRLGKPQSYVSTLKRVERRIHAGSARLQMRWGSIR